MRNGHSVRSVTLAVAIASMAACASKPVVEPPPPPTEQLISQADSALAAGQRDTALGLLDTAARNAPTSKEPWLRTAQIQFDGGNYGQAIIASQEVLQRDAADKTANSLITVSGLRVATQSLAALRDQSNLSGSVRGEAETLPRTMRESLGEDVLIPQVLLPVAAAAQKPQPAPASHYSYKRPAAPPAQASQNLKGQAPPPNGSSPTAANDPFGSLKN